MYVREKKNRSYACFMYNSTYNFSFVFISVCVYTRLYTPEGFCFYYYPRPRGECKALVAYERTQHCRSVDRTSQMVEILTDGRGIRGTPLSIFLLFSLSFSSLFFFFPRSISLFSALLPFLSTRSGESSFSASLSLSPLLSYLDTISSSFSLVEGLV